MEAGGATDRIAVRLRFRLTAQTTAPSTAATSAGHQSLSVEIACGGSVLGERPEHRVRVAGDVQQGDVEGVMAGCAQLEQRDRVAAILGGEQECPGGRIRQGCVLATRKRECRELSGRLRRGR